MSRSPSSSSESRPLPDGDDDDHGDKTQQTALLEYIDQRMLELTEERQHLQQQLSDLQAEHRIIESKMSKT
ncbi:hypothetical protein NESM_000127200 [Novymonas esmeraldas]|uniref:Uncharacterized protein n=1 Tax=Novymonas esmeraldas TaxID=1808958 RepID=A0AAW0F668_9TRYP